eukprot:scaffold1954_cov268-Pinguiococcus_pyrenoidosus.AAC.62
METPVRLCRRRPTASAFLGPRGRRPQLIMHHVQFKQGSLLAISIWTAQPSGQGEDPGRLAVCGLSQLGQLQRKAPLLFPFGPSGGVGKAFSAAFKSIGVLFLEGLIRLDVLVTTVGFALPSLHKGFRGGQLLLQRHPLKATSPAIEDIPHHLPVPSQVGFHPGQVLVVVLEEQLPHELLNGFRKGRMHGRVPDHVQHGNSNGLVRDGVVVVGHVRLFGGLHEFGLVGQRTFTQQGPDGQQHRS